MINLSGRNQLKVSSTVQNDKCYMLYVAIVMTDLPNLKLILISFGSCHFLNRKNTSFENDRCMFTRENEETNDGEYVSSWMEISFKVNVHHVLHFIEKVFQKTNRYFKRKNDVFKSIWCFNIYGYLSVLFQWLCGDIM